MSRLSLKLLDNWASVAVLVLLLFLPVYGQVMTYAEGAVFPVTSKIELLDVSPSEGGTQLRFRYAKLQRPVADRHQSLPVTCPIQSNARYGRGLRLSCSLRC